MNDKVVPWKNTGKNAPTLFRIRWDIQSGEWIPDPSGSYLGYYDEEKGKYVKRQEEQQPKLNLTTPKLELGTPSLGVIEKEEKE